MTSQLNRSIVCATLIAAAAFVWPSVSQATFVAFDQILHTSPAAVANPNAGSFTNCLAAEGCFGKGTNVDTPGGNFPATLSFTFSLTPAQVASITGGPGAQGTLTVVASRDIGHKTGAAPDDMLAAAGDSVSLGNLFANTIDSCPAGERGGAGYPADLVCGPNFHTDVTATDQLPIGTADIQSMVTNGTVDVVLTPSANMGRLKVFSVELLVTQVPEPSSFVVLAAGVLVLGFALRAKT